MVKGKVVPRYIIAILMLLQTGFVQAEEYQSLDAIQEAVQRFLEQEASTNGTPPRVEVNRLDPRLRLVACGQPLETSLAPGASPLGRVSVHVRCSGNKPWALYVSAIVQVYDWVVVTARPLSRNMVLGPGDVELSEQDIGTLRGSYFTDLNEVLGQKMTRNVRVGTPLTPHLVSPPMLIKRGERVSIVAVVSGLEVRMEGVAMEDGAKGKLIRVRNLSSKRQVEATVTAPGQVQVNM